MYTIFFYHGKQSQLVILHLKVCPFGDGSQLLFYTPTELVTQEMEPFHGYFCGQLLGFGVVLLCTFHRNMIQSLSIQVKKEIKDNELFGLVLENVFITHVAENAASTVRNSLSQLNRPQ